MTAPLDIEFVSDIACPWCLVGLRNLEAALGETAGEIEADIRFSPFELNPDMPGEGMDRAAYFAEKYRLPEAEAKARGEVIREAAAETGFTMNSGPGFRILNTFDAHRLLEWAGEAGHQRQLKHALFDAYFRDRRDISDAGELAEIAQAAGLDRARAIRILESEEYEEQVRDAEARHRARGIAAVPTAIVAGRYRINGAHPPERYAKALRHIAGEVAAA
ncbi:MAG: DsbA family oxidoreductase [Sphingomonadales bacterium]|nr:DsbA family oxidoreductase [Sphingomonadales bacterium]